MLNKNFDNIFNSLQDIYQNIISDKATLLVVIFIIAIFISITVFVYNKYIGDMFKANHVLNKEFRNKNKEIENDVVIILFYTEWCPYCKTALPEWDKFDAYVNNINNSNDYKITLTKVDCDKEPTLAEKYDITGYPTVKLIYKGKTFNYDAKINKEHLIQFLESSIE